MLQYVSCLILPKINAQDFYTVIIERGNMSNSMSHESRSELIANLRYRSGRDQNGFKQTQLKNVVQQQS